MVFGMMYLGDPICRNWGRFEADLVYCLIYNGLHERSSHLKLESLQVLPGSNLLMKTR